MAGRLRRKARARAAQTSVGMPTTGMHPIAKPSARVRARRRGETPWWSKWAAARLKEAIEMRVIILTLSIGWMRKTGFGVKDSQTNQKRQQEFWRVPILNGD